MPVQNKTDFSWRGRDWGFNPGLTPVNVKPSWNLGKKLQKRPDKKIDERKA